MKYLLDTNIISYSDKFRHPKIAGKILKKARLAGLRNVFISPITAGEIFAGIYSNPKMKEEKRQNLIKILSEANLLKIQRETAKIYGKLKVELGQRGVKLDDNDIWIASTALTYNAVLVTNDQDFEAIEDLQVENWMK